MGVMKQSLNLKGESLRSSSTTISIKISMVAPSKGELLLCANQRVLLLKNKR